LPRDRVSDREGRASGQGALRALGEQYQDPHDGPRKYQEIYGGLSLRRASDGDAARDGRRAVNILSRREQYQRSRVAAAADAPADRKNPDPRGVCVSAYQGPPVRLSR